MKCDHEVVYKTPSGDYRCNNCNQYLAKEEVEGSSKITVDMHQNEVDSLKATLSEVKWELNTKDEALKRTLDELHQCEAYLIQIESNNNLIIQENDELKIVVKNLCRIIGGVTKNGVCK